MGKLARYFWPKTALFFYIAEERIETAFGFFEKGSVDMVMRKSFSAQEKEKFFDWYREIRQTYPKLYAVSMIETLNQGALPGCQIHSFEKYGVDEALSRHLCIDDCWTAHVSLVETKWFEEKFKAVELDLLYSPFVLLYRHVRRDLDDVPGIYILHQNGMLYMMVLTQDRLWYAHTAAVPFGGAENPVEAGIDVDEVDDLAFDLDLLDEDESVDVLTGSEGLDELEPETSEEKESDNLELLEYNLNLYEEVKETISRYYRDDRYDKSFVQKAMLYDVDGKVTDFVRYVEDELFMKAAQVSFDPVTVMAELAAKEVG